MTWVEQESVVDDIEKIPRSNVSYRLLKPTWIREMESFGVNEPFQYLLCLFPHLQDIETATELNWPEGDIAPKLSELIKFFGIMLAMALDPIRGSRSDYWNRDNTGKNTVYSARNYGEKFGMTRERFEQIVKHLRLDTYDEERTVSEDAWKPIRSFVRAFNENRRNTVIPGKMICIDEFMSQWEGRELKYHPLGCPHVTKIPRKPVSSLHWGY